MKQNFNLQVFENYLGKSASRRSKTLQIWSTFLNKLKDMGYCICFSLKPAASNMLDCWYFAIQKCS
jgi:hypothetical protein